MSQGRAERKAVLMRKVEELIEELLEWEAENEGPSLGEIEEEVLAVRQKLGQELLGSVVKHQGSVRPVPGPSCEACGQEMRYKGLKGKQVESLAGEAKIERGYYYCPGCGAGIFPPG